MSQAVSFSSSELLAEPVEPEKRKPDYPAECHDHPFYNVAQYAFNSVYDRVVPNYHHSRLNNFNCNRQRQLIKDFKENAPEQKEELKSLYVAAFIVGSDQQAQKDYPFFDALKKMICDQMQPPPVSIRQKDRILQDLNSIACYAAEEGSVYASEQGYRL